MFKENGLRLVVIISDGIRGHVNQSRGVASWLSRLTGAEYTGTAGAGAEVLELEVPKLEGMNRFKVRQNAAKLKRAALEWLKAAEGEAMLEQVAQWLQERGIAEERTLCGRTSSGQKPSVIFISAGSMPAFYSLALGRIYGCPCATIMTPSVTGTAPFDFAIVPGHDHPAKAPNVLTTLGAPNLIVREELELAGRALLRDYPPKSGRRWGILLGGDDKNYKVTAEWVRGSAGEIFREAESCGADLYITTSRRTSKAAEDALKAMAAECRNVRFMLMASADPSNPVPAMLGACDEIFVTEDSVNMVSEAITAGHRAVLLRVERAGALKRLLQTATRMLVSSGLLPTKALWGAPRFDLAFQSFRDMGLLVDFTDWLREPRQGNAQPAPAQDFNEARRAALWILDRL